MSIDAKASRQRGKSSSLPALADLERELKEREKRASELDRARVLEAKQQADRALAEKRQELDWKERERREELTASSENEARRRLERYKTALAEKEARLKDTRERTVELGVAWLLGERT